MRWQVENLKCDNYTTGSMRLTNIETGEPELNMIYDKYLENDNLR